MPVISIAVGTPASPSRALGLTVPVVRRTVRCAVQTTPLREMYAVVQAARAAEAERKRNEGGSASGGIIAPAAVRATIVSTSATAADAAESVAAASGSDSDEEEIDEDHAEFKQLARELDQLESPPMSPQPSIEAQHNSTLAAATWAASSSQPLPQLPPSTLISFDDIQTALNYYSPRSLEPEEIRELRQLLLEHDLSDGVTLETLTEILNTIKDKAAAASASEGDELEESSRGAVNPVAVFARALRGGDQFGSSSPQLQQQSPSSLRTASSSLSLSDDSLVSSTGSAPSLLSSASSSSLASALQRSQKEIQRLSHQFTMLRDYNARTETQLAQVTEEAQALMLECKMLRETKEDLVAELARAKAMSAEAASKAQAASNAASQAAADLAALRKSHGVVQHRAEIARHASSKYETALTHARKNSISQIEAAREAATREAAFAQARMMAENETLKAQLADLEAQFAAYQSEQTELAERAAAEASDPDRDRFRGGDSAYDRGSAFSPDFARVRRIGATASPNHPTTSEAAADSSAAASPASAAALFEYLRSIQAKAQGRTRHSRSGGSGGSEGSASNGSRHSSSHSGTDLSGLLSPLGEEHEPEPDHDGAEKLSAIDLIQQHDEEVARISGHSGSSSNGVQPQSNPAAVAVVLVTTDTQTELSMLQDDSDAAAANETSTNPESHRSKGKKSKKASGTSPAADASIAPDSVIAEIESLKQSLAALRAEQDRWVHDREALEKQLAAATAAAAAGASFSLAVPPVSPGGGHIRSLSSSAASSAPVEPPHSPARTKSKGGRQHHKQQLQQVNSAEGGVEQAASASTSANATPVASDSAAPLASLPPVATATAAAVGASPRPTAPTRRPLPRSLVDPAVFLAATIQSAPVSAAPSQPSSGRGSPSMSSAHRGLPPTGLAAEVTPPKTRHSTVALNGITVTPPHSARQHTPPALSHLSSQAAYELGFERGLHAQSAAALVATSAIKQQPASSGGKGSRSRGAPQPSAAAASAASTRLLMTPTTAAALARDLGHQPLSPLSQLKSKILAPAPHPSHSRSQHRRSRSSNAAIPELASTASSAVAAVAAESPFASPVAAASAAVAKDLFASDPEYAAAAGSTDSPIVMSLLIVSANDPDADVASFERDLAFAVAVTAAAAEATIADADAPSMDSSSTPAATATATKTKGGKKKTRGGKSAVASSAAALESSAPATVLDSAAAAADPEAATPSAALDTPAGAEDDDDAPGWAPAADWPVHTASATAAAGAASAAVPASHGKKKKGSASAPTAGKGKKSAAASSTSVSRSSAAAAAPVVSARLASDLRAIASVTSLDSALLDGPPKMQPALYHAAPLLQCSIL